MLTDKAIETDDELEFAVFCIENVAQRLRVPAARVCAAFAGAGGILNGYIVPCFDVLHTQGREYIVDDLVSLMEKRGMLRDGVLV